MQRAQPRRGTVDGDFRDVPRVEFRAVARWRCAALALERLTEGLDGSTLHWSQTPAALAARADLNALAEGIAESAESADSAQVRLVRLVRPRLALIWLELDALRSHAAGWMDPDAPGTTLVPNPALPAT